MDVEVQLKALLENYNDWNKKLDGFILAYQSMLLRLDQIEQALLIKKQPKVEDDDISLFTNQTRMTI